MIIYKNLSDLLVFIENPNTNNESLADRLTFSESVTRPYSKGVVASHTLTFSQFAVWYLPSYTVVSAPSAPVTVTGTTPNPILSVTIPEIVQPTTPVVTFAYGSLSVSVKIPEFSDVDAVEQRRIQRETRGGDLILYRDPSWSSKETLSLEFSFVDDYTTAKMKTFVAQTLGLPITYTDYIGNQYLCIIISPEIEVKTPGRYNNAFSLTLEVLYS